MKRKRSVRIGKEREEPGMVGQSIIEGDWGGVYCVLVDNKLENPDSIQANDNG